MSRSHSWTEVQRAMLAELAGHHSAAVVADKINAATGSVFTRNAIIGARDRNKNPCRPRAASVPRPRIARVRPATTPRPKVEAPPPPQLIPSLGIPFLDTVFGQCRYITSSDGPALVCGHTVVDKKSYCAWHYAECTFQRGVRVVSVPQNRNQHYAPTEPGTHG